MNKKEAIELLRQALSKIPHLRELHYDNQKFKLWRNRVETIIKYGLDGDDYNTFESVEPLAFLEDIGIENIEQSLDYPKKLKDYETALKSIIQKNEILGIEGEGDKGGEVGKIEITKALELLKQRLDEIPKLRTLPPDRQQYQEWRGKVCNILELTFGNTSREYNNFARAVNVDYLVYTKKEKLDKYNKELDAYETALKSAINKCELLEAEEKPQLNRREKPKSILKKVWRKPWNIFIVGIPVLAALIYVIDYFWKFFSK